MDNVKTKMHEALIASTSNAQPDYYKDMSEVDAELEAARQMRSSAVAAADTLVIGSGHPPQTHETRHVIEQRSSAEMYAADLRIQQAEGARQIARGEWIAKHGRPVGI